MSPVVVSPHNRCWVDLEALAWNLAELRAGLPRGVRVAGVVKADAYGHGLLPVARRLKAAGAEALAVALVGEAAALRRGGVAGPILVLLGLAPGEARRAAEMGLTPVLYRREDLAAFAAAGRAAGREVACHLKVDTGMGRLGVTPAEALEVLAWSREQEGLVVSGLVSHLATSGDPESALAKRQAALFDELLTEARARGFVLADSSLCGSGGALAPPPAAPGPPALVRLGVSLYGGLPDPASAGVARLAGVMSYQSRLISVKPVAAGATVSYGATWTAPADTWLGVVPAGYAEGYPRAASGRAWMLVDGQRVPVRGRVCMNLTVVDMGGLARIPAVGAPVVLLGRQGADEIGLEELAGWADTIGYEVTCRLGAANRRRYRRA
ncbi:MAG: alanine racemase [Deltaproteobacteria bacterium]|nr:alanine racemase [Deltaproteobacteria bacterium]